MRILFYISPNQSERKNFDFIAQGMRRHDEHVTVLDKSFPNPSVVADYDVVFISRVVDTSLRLMNACLAYGTHFVYFDKAYLSRGGWRSEHPAVYRRFSLDSFHPFHYFQSVPHPPDRWEALGIKLRPLRKTGEHIVVAGCSQKFGEWCGINVIEYDRWMVSEIRSRTKRPIVYRPRPVRTALPPIPGTTYSGRSRKIWDELHNAHALVTFSSNVAVDALLWGIPVFVLGPSIARPISNHDLSAIENPWFPTDEERYQWCCDVAYCQWNTDEVKDGTVWQELKETIARTSGERRISLGEPFLSVKSWS